MAENSKIEWTDHTFNGWIGCTKVGPGCDHCYAEAMMDKRMGKVAWGPGQQRMRTSEANWRLPLKWNRQAAAEGKRYRVFCSSLADVFDNEVDPAWRLDLFRLIADTPNLDWLLLTKRIGNVASMLGNYRTVPLLPNIWLGATVVNQEEANRDIPKLLAVPARVRFLSIEPMLSAIDLSGLPGVGRWRIDALRGEWERTDLGSGFEEPDTIWHESGPALHWIICGGESGPKARPIHPDWARSLRDQCAAANVPFLFKQWGEWLPGSQAREVGNQMALVGSCIRAWKWDDGTHAWHIGKKAAGRLLDGIEHNGFPQDAR